ncbi:MAG TPA: rod shape-determining protein MreC [Candidatus Competibacter sp.]|nr:rod shape-determining protein MreC [Candidatus Competibacter sp.]HRX61412.1 rod shape-determining protein MreC [Candidatus Competibacter sp.]HUM92197.1 rod shape-determining protein MreC [Candidatus Competibacter sp.]
MAALKPSKRIQYLFAVNPTAILRLAGWVMLSIALMTVDHRYHYLNVLHDVLSTAAYPVHYLVRLPTATKSWLTENLAGRGALLEENARLREKQLFLNAQLQKLTVLEAENRRLRSLLESAVNTPEHVLIAEMLVVDFDLYRHRILLNRGRQHGVYVGEPVLDQYGIVGQIVQADPFTSTAIFITDVNHALPIEIARTGVRTLALGTGDFQELKLPHIPNNGDVKVGDVLITSGLGGRFPHGYPVGTVTKVEFDPGSPFANITAKPFAQLDRIREVMLLENEPSRVEGATAAAPTGARPP